MNVLPKLAIKIIVGSTRQNRFGDKPAQWMYDIARKRSELDAEFLDLRDYPLPFFNEPASPAMAGGKYANEVVAKWAGKIQTADGFIIVTPEYNHGYPAVLKNAMDYIYNEWNNKAIGFVSYGGVGGARSIEQLRQVAIELQMAPIRNAVHIQAFWTLLDENGNLKTGALDSLGDAAEKFLDQLIWWTRALKAAREHGNT